MNKVRENIGKTRGKVVTRTTADTSIIRDMRTAR
jgi:hypothetical protein